MCLVAFYTEWRIILFGHREKRNLKYDWSKCGICQNKIALSQRVFSSYFWIDIFSIEWITFPHYFAQITQRTGKSLGLVCCIFDQCDPFHFLSTLGTCSPTAFSAPRESFGRHRREDWYRTTYQTNVSILENSSTKVCKLKIFVCYIWTFKVEEKLSAKFVFSVIRSYALLQTQPLNKWATDAECCKIKSDQVNDGAQIPVVIDWSTFPDAYVNGITGKFYLENK